MADFQVHLGKSRTFTLTPTVDSVPTTNGANPVFSSTTPTQVEFTPNPANGFLCDIKGLVEGVAAIQWTFQTGPAAVEVAGGFTLEVLAPDANGGVVTAGDEF
jgi:hypothetical protein